MVKENLFFRFEFFYLIGFHFVGNAETTELFKCKRPSTVCCASKELVHETLSQLLQSQPTPQIGYADSTQKIAETTEVNLNQGEGLK